MNRETLSDPAHAKPEAHSRVRDANGQPLIRTLANPWVIAAAVFLLLPRRVKRPLLKAALPLALGLLKAR